VTGGREKNRKQNPLKKQRAAPDVRAYRPLKSHGTILEPALFSLRANSEAEKEK